MDTVAVPGVACPCPGTPHPEGDVVTLRARLGLASGVELQSIIVTANAQGQPTSVVTGLLLEAYIRLGVSDWTFVDDKGKPIPVTSETIQSMILDDFTLATPIAEKANELYEGPVLGPLVNGAAKSSPTTTTAKSTSQPATGSRKNPKPSRRSSTSTTQTGATVLTSV